MIPWERDLYISKVNTWVKEETDKMKQTQMEQESKLNQMVSKIRQKRKR